MTRRESFAVDRPPTIELRLASGNASLLPGPEGAVEIEVSGPSLEDFSIDRSGDHFILAPPEGRRGRWGSYHVTVRLPAGSRLEARLASADLTAEVELASLRADTASGRLRIGRVTGDARLKSASGDMGLEAVGGRLVATTASGDVRAGTLEGPVQVATASGDVVVGEARGPFVFRTASGDLELGRYGGEDLQGKAISGDLRIGLEGGRTWRLDVTTLSGDVRSEFPVGENAGEAPARITVRTVSGDVFLRAAS